MLDFIFYHTPLFYLIQSVWRDEAFAYFMAKPNIIQVIINTAYDFNPPLYYLALHFWMQIVGQSDEGLRLLSFIAHLATVYIAYLLAEKVTSKKFAYFVALFTFLNPMLLYYAFEMRMYSFYALFTAASLYFFYIKNWRWYTISSVLGLYTHSFFPLIIVSYASYLWIRKQLTKKNLILVFTPFLFYLLWLPILINQFFQSKNSWLFPADFQLIAASLGNLFTSYEGTPGNLWGYTAALSAVIILFMAIALKHKKNEAQLLTIPIFLPLFIILAYSLIKRPLYVNRYMIFVTVFEVLIISLGVWSIKHKLWRYFIAIFWLSFVVILNISPIPYRKKTDFKTTFREINRLAQENDFVYTRTPIAFLESAYYFKNKDKVFVYNPDNITIPNYIGVTVVFPDVSRLTFPPPPSKTFLVDDHANYELIINR